jgi:hypothetical protein
LKNLSNYDVILNKHAFFIFKRRTLFLSPYPKSANIADFPKHKTVCDILLPL